MTTIPDQPDGTVDDIRAFLQMLYGPGVGYCHVVYGAQPYRNDKGKITHRIWSERIGKRFAFRYPEQTDAIVAKILELDRRGADVYVCTGLMRTATSRAKENLAGLWCLHADADHDDPSRIDAIRSVGWCAVGSGTAGHDHIYAPLSEWVPGAQCEDLEDALVDLLNADAKKRGNDVLRPPRTHNYKATVDGGEPNPVVWSVRFSGARCDPRFVARLLDVDLDRPKARCIPKATRTKVERTGGRAESEEFDLESFPKVKAAVKKDSGDRSSDTFGVIAACYDAKRTFAQACWAVYQSPSLTERLDERKEDHEEDLLRCWRRAVDARQRQAQEQRAGGAVLNGDTSGDNFFDGDPIPLTVWVPIPPFPVDALPPQIADMVAAVAEATQTDPAMAATSALSVLSACNGGCAQIGIRRGWCEPLNSYAVTIAAPGERKSAVQRAMTAPVYEAERQLAEEGRDERIAADTRKQVAVKAAEHRLQSAAMAAAGKQKAKGDAVDPGESMDAAIAAGCEAEAIEVPVAPRLIFDDITPEAAASMLAEQGGRAAIFSAEGGPFDVIAGRYNQGKANLDVWLKGHSGDDLRVDRKGRAPEYVRQPALTIGLMIQPLVLSSIAANREFRGRGLLARFLYSWPAPMVGRRGIGTPVPPEVETAYTTATVALTKGMAAHVGRPVTLRLTSAARAALQAIEAAVEPTLAGDGELAPLADWGAKHVGAIARIAGNLHMASYDSVTTALREDVSEQTVLAAARIGAYFKAGAINAFVDMGVDRVAADAAYLLERIVGEGRDEVSERDLFTMGSRARFRKMADLAPVLQRLIDHRYLAAMPTRLQGSDPGRPPSIRYKVHPHAAKTAETTEGAASAGEEGTFAVFAAPSELDGGHSPNQQAQTDAPPPAERQQSSAATADAPVESAPTTIGVVRHNGQQPSSADTGEGVFWVRCDECGHKVNPASVIDGACLVCRVPGKHCGHPPIGVVHSENDLCHWCYHEAAYRGECARPVSCDECHGPLCTHPELSVGRCDGCVERWGPPSEHDPFTQEVVAVQRRVRERLWPASVESPAGTTDDQTNGEMSSPKNPRRLIRADCLGCEEPTWIAPDTRLCLKCAVSTLLGDGDETRRVNM